MTMTEAELSEIEKRWAVDSSMAGRDVAKLLAEVRRLQANLRHVLNRELGNAIYRTDA